MRIISLSVRLFANILAGHLLILFMAGGLAVLLGLAALGVVTLPIGDRFFLFEVGLVATLQAFIFATLTSIYLGERGRRRPLEEDPMDLAAPDLPSHRPPTTATDAGKAIALGVGAGLGRRPRHRHRHHLRQGDRVGHPPARDARRDHEHPVARLRPHRGDRVLRVIFGLIAFFL